MDKFKPCPFCGCSEIRMLTTIFDCDIFCKECGASITRQNYTPCDSLAQSMREAKPIAIEAWNRRADNKEIDFDYEAED